ncbi:hypothetical protein BDF19DRAFT_413828 [Syncephalis fuscata]|nr:hypothetical protein BDF19DRAFT_413828 [Syncephalis fuscata]
MVDVQPLDPFDLDYSVNAGHDPSTMSTLSEISHSKMAGHSMETSVATLDNDESQDIESIEHLEDELLVSAQHDDDEFLLSVVDATETEEEDLLAVDESDMTSSSTAITDNIETLPSTTASALNHTSLDSIAAPTNNDISIAHDDNDEHLLLEIDEVEAATTTAIVEDTAKVTTEALVGMTSMTAIPTTINDKNAQNDPSYQLAVTEETWTDTLQQPHSVEHIEDEEALVATPIATDQTVDKEMLDRVPCIYLQHQGVWYSMFRSDPSSPEQEVFFNQDSELTLYYCDLLQFTQTLKESYMLEDREVTLEFPSLELLFTESSSYMHDYTLRDIYDMYKALWSTQRDTTADDAPEFLRILLTDRPNTQEQLTRLQQLVTGGGLSLEHSITMDTSDKFSPSNEDTSVLDTWEEEVASIASNSVVHSPGHSTDGIIEKTDNNNDDNETVEASVSDVVQNEAQIMQSNIAVVDTVTTSIHPVKSHYRRMAMLMMIILLMVATAMKIIRYSSGNYNSNNNSSKIVDQGNSESSQMDNYVEDSLVDTAWTESVSITTTTTTTTVASHDLDDHEENDYGLIDSLVNTPPVTTLELTKDDGTNHTEDVLSSGSKRQLTTSDLDETENKRVRQV